MLETLLIAWGIAAFLCFITIIIAWKPNIGQQVMGLGNVLYVTTVVLGLIWLFNFSDMIA